MSMTAFAALVRRDLYLYITDRRAVIMSLAAPILIGSFFGYIFGGVANDAPSARVPVAVIDNDQSEISRRLVAGLTADRMLEIRPGTLEQARAAVRGGKTTVAVAIPQGFGPQAAQALFRGGNPPELELLYDPSHGPEMGMVRGILTQHIMESVGAGFFGGGGGRGGLTMPFTTREEPVTARQGVAYNAMGHAFAGMTVQFILFMGIDAGMSVIYQRRSGIWKRLRAAPISRFVVIGSRAASATLIAVFIMFVVFGFARVVFHVRVEGSLAGFVAVAVAFGLMTSTFGLLIASSGKTPEATRGLAILATLLLVMLGGAWVPAFIFPQWLQKASFAIPTRWAVDALDGVTWRGLGFAWALGPVAALLGFTVLFGALALWLFRWDEA